MQTLAASQEQLRRGSQRFGCRALTGTCFYKDTLGSKFTLTKYLRLVHKKKTGHFMTPAVLTISPTTSLMSRRWQNKWQNQALQDRDTVLTKKSDSFQNKHVALTVTQPKELQKFGLILPKTSAFWLSDLIPSAIINTLLCLQLHKQCLVFSETMQLWAVSVIVYFISSLSCHLFTFLETATP